MFSECEYRVIDRFANEHRWLSNFAPIVLEYEGHTILSVEHGYQLAKFIHAPDVCLMVANADTPGKAKRLSRVYADRIRSDWLEVRDKVMRELLDMKFNQPPYRQLLVNTGDALLIEGNTWGDTYWGVCKGHGHNILGKMLMDIRSRLIKENHDS